MIQNFSRHNCSSWIQSRCNMLENCVQEKTGVFQTWSFLQHRLTEALRRLAHCNRCGIHALIKDPMTSSSRNTVKGFCPELGQIATVCSFLMDCGELPAFSLQKSRFVFTKSSTLSLDLLIKEGEFPDDETRHRLRSNSCLHITSALPHESCFCPLPSECQAQGLMLNETGTLSRRHL